VIDINDLKSRAWAEISLENIEYNYREIRKRVPQEAKMCCVVKADAYGHGAPEVAKRLERAGANFFAVSNIDEALQLRSVNIQLPILILGYTPPARAKELADNDISQCVYSFEYADLLTQEANKFNLKISVHIKIDSGMGRLGFIFRHDEESFEELIDVCSRDCFVLDGIFTHFPTADAGDSCREATKAHFEHFQRVVTALEEKGIFFKIKHCANSATALDYPEYSMDMVRAGIALYGVLPSNDMNTHISLKPTMTLKSVISNIKRVKKGDTIGYGAEYIAPRDMRIATLPI
jgi:alanine racemase